MANLTISSVCNMKCPYCFANEYMEEAKASHASDFITLEEFEKRLDFLERSGIREVRLIGGEPTLHHQFSEIIQLSRSRAKPIWVFSHGLMSERAIACLEKVPISDCSVLVNINAMRTPTGPDEAEMNWRISNIRRLGPRALLGFNIHRPDFDLEPVFQIIKGNGCRPSVRLGLANPILLAQNEYLHPKQYQFVGQRIVHFARRANELGISLEFDCGFVRCMFSDKDIQTLLECNVHLGWHCNAVLDISLDGQAIHCFPLTGRFQVPFDGFVDAGTLRAQLHAQAGPFRTAGIYPECSTCPFKTTGECPGGCLAATMRRLNHVAFEVRVPSRTKE